MHFKNSLPSPKLKCSMFGVSGASQGEFVRVSGNDFFLGDDKKPLKFIGCNSYLLLVGFFYPCCENLRSSLFSNSAKNQDSMMIRLVNIFEPQTIGLEVVVL